VASLLKMYCAGRYLTLCMLSMLLLHHGAGISVAQQNAVNGRYYPLNQSAPPGVAGQWAGILGKSTPGYFQNVKFEIQNGGKVAIYGRATPQSAKQVELTSPAMLGLAVGHTYRCKISNLTNFPGQSLYPTVELIDRLHTPAELAGQFPVPIQITEEEIEHALQGRMVTKVVFLEQPQMAEPRELRDEIAIVSVPTSVNLLAEADRVGRPVLIIRIGGRQPNPHGEEASFYGTGAPFLVAKQNKQTKHSQVSGRQTNHGSANIQRQSQALAFPRKEKP